MIVVLAGGVGGSKFLKGIVSATEEEITAVINTGDDIDRFGLYISPDIDINIYTLADVIHQQGWGFKDETYSCQSILSKVYEEDCWFNLGDKDLATHIYRTFLLKQNRSLSEVTLKMCEEWNIPIRILPMSNEPVTTYIHTPGGKFHFQEYLIKRKMSDQVLKIEFNGIENASPTPGILEAIRKSDLILFAPSNPLVSINPILSLPGIKKAILESKAKVVAVSPVVGGDVIKGPGARMLKDLGIDVSPLGIASCYSDLLDAMVIDCRDEEYAESLKQLNMETLVTDTIMDSDHKKRKLAEKVMDFVRYQLV
ncbi:2-phospho-L-lactate transferase [Paenibacillus sp. BSR1-1]|uniref:2-phospho-L-lactate transferase n=1 Tax=Paenibacillus sp. BSR1-1 TaxID=3020845 RepID=UPI0025B0E6B3|nr:2-phospho-L-lactate transferase [Paenibacillus sp. BSR1-1]MDN3016189.1 2-phospho-L-lactate transferase [Paenibacillus sp. BSR1-1]